MIYVPPTVEYEGDNPSLFLAGGISDCKVWQQSMVECVCRFRSRPLLADQVLTWEISS
jgi:hypothetical protein